MNVSFVHSFTIQQQQQQSITSYFVSTPHHTTLHYTTLHTIPHYTLYHTTLPSQNFIPPSSFLLPPSTVTNQSTKPNQTRTRTRTRTMPISWTPHMDQKLLLAVISTVRLDAEILVEKWRELFLGMWYIPGHVPISFPIVFVSLFSSFIHSSHWGRDNIG